MSCLRYLLPLALSLSACTLEQQIASTCASYCAQAAECDGDVEQDSCVEECEEALDDCDEDNVEPTLDDLDDCAEETCDDFGACTLGAAAECYFGI